MTGKSGLNDLVDNIVNDGILGHADSPTDELDQMVVGTVEDQTHGLSKHFKRHLEDSMIDAIGEVKAAIKDGLIPADDPAVKLALDDVKRIAGKK